MTEDAQTSPAFAGFTADIVAAYVSNNTVSATELPSLISSVHGALMQMDAPPAPAIEPPTPAVPIKKSITPDFLISLEDGRHYKSLKRHLSTHGMSPDDYRTKWGLPKNYPMVAANYSAQRSGLAKTLGLGRKPAPTTGAQASKAETIAPLKAKRAKQAA